MSKKLDVFALKKLLHILIKKGKKQIALNAYLNLLRDLNKSNKRLSAADIFQEAFNNIKPILSIQKVKKSSKVFYLPKIINVEQRTNLSLF
jgi:ribosomal protein S7